MNKKKEPDKRDAALLDALQKKMAQADREVRPPVTLSPCMIVRKLERESRPGPVRTFSRRAAAVALSALLLAVAVTGGLLAQRQLETLPAESGSPVSEEAADAFYQPDLQTDRPVTYEDICLALEQIRQRQQAGRDTAAVSRAWTDLLSLPQREAGASAARLAAVSRDDTTTSESSSEEVSSEEPVVSESPWESDIPVSNEPTTNEPTTNEPASRPAVTTPPAVSEVGEPEASHPGGTGPENTFSTAPIVSDIQPPAGGTSAEEGNGIIIDPGWQQPQGGEEDLPQTSEEYTDAEEDVLTPITYQTQEPAVNEADAVAAADGYLYILSQQSQQGRLLHIVKTDGEKMERLSTTPVGYTAAGEVELYVQGDRLAVMGSRSEALDGPADAGYVQVEIYDISDPARPALTRTFKQQGQLTGSRMVDGTLYLSTTVTYSDLSALNAQSVERYLPCYWDSDVGSVTYLAPEQVQIVQDTDAASYCFVAAVDLAGGSRMQACLGGGDLLYSDAASIYIAAVRRTPERVFSEILRISAGDTLRYTGRARVPGLVTDSFFMDTENGYLRVFTANAGGQGTSLYVLDQGLAITGSRENIAPGQAVQSVRFSGDRAYLSVAGGADALLTGDMQEPARPILSGGYQAAGLSGTLYPLDGGRMLSLEVSDGGISLYLFATGQGAGAEAVATCRLETEGDTLDSEAAYNHHAFTYWAEGKTCYIPLHTGKGFSGILALEITGDTIAPAGIFTTAQGDGSSLFRVQPGDWARRTVIMDGVGYAVADGAVLCFDLEEMDARSVLRLYEDEPKNIDFSGVDRTPIISILIS